MADDEQDAQPTQQTQPKGIDPKTGEPYEPVEIPVPKRSAFDSLLERAEKRPPDEHETGRGPRPQHAGGAPVDEFERFEELPRKLVNTSKTTGR